MAAAATTPAASLPGRWMLMVGSGLRSLYLGDVGAVTRRVAISLPFNSLRLLS